MPSEVIVTRNPPIDCGKIGFDFGIKSQRVVARGGGGDDLRNAGVHGIRLEFLEIP